MNFDQDNKTLREKHARGGKNSTQVVTPEQTLRKNGAYDLAKQRPKFRIDRSRVE